MKKRTNDPYDHSSRTEGQTDEEGPSKEHRETADGDSTRRNELRPEERREQDGYGPRTHEQTRTTRKEGA